MTDREMIEPSRCTPPHRHVLEHGSTLCDCGAVSAMLTAARTAVVVSMLDSVQQHAMGLMYKPKGGGDADC